MSFSVRQYESKWRITIHNEEWEFEDDTEMKKVFDKLIEFKKAHGQLKQKDKKIR